MEAGKRRQARKSVLADNFMSNINKQDEDVKQVQANVEDSEPKRIRKASRKSALADNFLNKVAAK